MTCINCNEEMVGDGYTSVLRCPNAEESDAIDFAASDEGPFYCELDLSE